MPSPPHSIHPHGQRRGPLQPRSPSLLLVLLLVTIGAMIYWWPDEPVPSGPSESVVNTNEN